MAYITLILLCVYVCACLCVCVLVVASNQGFYHWRKKQGGYSPPPHLFRKVGRLSKPIALL